MNIYASKEFAADPIPRWEGAPRFCACGKRVNAYHDPYNAYPKCYQCERVVAEKPVDLVADMIQRLESAGGRPVPIKVYYTSQGFSHRQVTESFRMVRMLLEERSLEVRTHRGHGHSLVDRGRA
jgi:hypothetical protein